MMARHLHRRSPLSGLTLFPPSPISFPHFSLPFLFFSIPEVGLGYFGERVWRLGLRKLELGLCFGILGF